MKYKPILEKKDIDHIKYFAEMDCKQDCDECPLLTKGDSYPCIRDIAIRLMKQIKE